jgi:hypothetical protein
MGFKPTTTRISDGTPVDAATTNPCLDDLQNNILYLKAMVDDISGGEALMRHGVAMKSDVTAAHALYWNGVTAQYELALADGTSREEVVGVCYIKTAAQAGDLLTMGTKPLDITPALQTGDVLQIGHYYLSALQPGKLTATPPSTRATSVLVDDGQGNVLVLPQTGSRGFQGYRGYQGHRGYQGFQGFKGFQGYRGPAVAGGSATGTTTDAYVVVYDSSTMAGGILFAGSVKNTGPNGLGLRLTMTDAFGTSDNLDATVAAAAASSFNSHTAAGLAIPPFVRLQVLVQAQTPGNQTTYNLKLSRTG